MRKFNTGDRVIVRWETGIVETGTVAGETAPIRGESESLRLVDLELDDRTRCTAPASRVKTLEDEAADRRNERYLGVRGWASTAGEI